MPPSSLAFGWRKSGIQEEVAATQRTCPIMEQGEQAKASVEQNQASSVASIQPSRRGEKNRCKRCKALMLCEMQAAP